MKIQLNIKKAFLFILLLNFSLANAQNLFINGDFQDPNTNDNYDPSDPNGCGSDGLMDCPNPVIQLPFFAGYSCSPGFPRVIGWDPVVNHVGWANPFFKCAGETSYAGACSPGVDVNRCNRHGEINTLPAAAAAQGLNIDQNNFVGLRTYLETPANFPQAKQIRAYITGKFSTPLVAGQTYCLSFYMMLASHSKYTTEGIQWKFSNAPLSIPPSGSNLLHQKSLAVNANNQNGANDPTDGLYNLRVTDQDNWTLVTASYTAVGGEQYFTIGNFEKDNQIDPQINPNATAPIRNWTYYYFDNFSLVPITPLQVTSTNPTCGNSNGTITLSDPNAGILPNTNYDVNYEKDGVVVGPITLTSNNSGEIIIPNLGTGNYTNFEIVTSSCPMQSSDVINLTSSSFNFNVLSSLNPTSCGGTDGNITIDGLAANTTYVVSYDLNGTTVSAGNLTSNANGELIISNLGIGTYTNFSLDLIGCAATNNQVVDLTYDLPITIPSDFTICNGEDTLLNATSSVAGVSFMWNNGVINNQLFTPTNTATYVVTATITDAGVTCSATDSLVITLGTTPVVDAGADTVICNGESYILTAFNPDGAVLSWDNGVVDGVPFVPDSPKLYHVTADLNGCLSMDSVSIDLNDLPDLTVPNDISICEGESVILNATSSNPNTLISWDNGVVNNQEFTPNTTQNYTATATLIQNNLTCSVSDDVIVTVNPLPTVQADANGQTQISICEGEPYVLTAVNPDNAIITWDNGVTDGIQFTPIDSNVYHVTAELNGCFAFDSIIINTISSPVIELIANQTICENDSVLLFGTAYPTNATITWSAGVVNNSYVSPSSTQTYTITASLGNCSTTEDVTVFVSQSPNSSFNFSPNPVTIDDTQVQFTQFETEPNETYYWSFGDNTNSSIENPIHVYPEVPNVNYKVQLVVVNEYGCSDTSTVDLLVNDVLVYYVPNAFTPGDDAFNNVFKPVFTSGFDPYDYHLIIFNRWGEIVFESYNDQIGWDGQMADGRIQDGVYVWTIEFGELLTDKKYRINGTVTLLK